ncbi:phosphoribulokinase [Planococcus liqunii]|uniref:uridine kinase family protein n=1 Tax=Planococcus liqunii TaxID=3058394 RepID=UPI00260C2152|nr:phosphoribulokinase [Planococcus sp. N056]WKA52939.1 phosphoribulokinase [Planococcus sp. N056]
MEKLLSWISLANKPIVIGVSGHGAAGKTTFTNRLLNLMDEKKVNYLNTDPYIVSSQVRKHTTIDYSYQNENHRYKMTACHPAAHHLPSLERDVQMIRNGMDVYTIATHYKQSEFLSSKNNVTIVEGMSAAFIDPALFDVKIYFYTDGETEFRRRSGRDVIERGTEINYLRQSHEERRIQYELFMHPYSRHFDIIIKTTDEQTSVEKAVFDFKWNSQ